MIPALFGNNTQNYENAVFFLIFGKFKFKCMKRVFLLAIAILAALVAQARKPELKFKPDGTFKIIQLTDLHIRTINPEQADRVYSRIKYLAETEKPDLFVVTGDMILIRPAEPEITRFMSVLDETGVPWVVAFGNHDEQQDLTRAEMSELYVSGRQSLNMLNDAGELADVEIPVKSSKGDGTPFYVFCMDSHSYSTDPKIEGYDWFTPEQVQWLRDCCMNRTGTDGKVAPSMAFFHIPLCEYIDAWSGRDNPREGYASKKQCDGIRGESIACGGLNSGMFSAMKETGSIMGVSVGHDHDNDFIAVYRDIALCYGRFSGDNTVYNHLPHGARVFLVREGQSGFETWIHEGDGRIVNHNLFDGHELTQDKRDRALPYGLWFDIPIEK